MAKCIQLGNINNHFEREVFNYLCKSLPDDYIVFPPFSIFGNTQREIDGLVIGPKCLFTIEIKSHEGTITKKGNNPTKFINNNGEEKAFRGYEDPIEQSTKQAKALSSYLSMHFGRSLMWVKPILVFPSGNRFDVPSEYRNVANTNFSSLVLAMNEAPQYIQEFQPPHKKEIPEQLRNLVAKSIKDGTESLTSKDLADIEEIKKTLPPSFSQQNSTIHSNTREASRNQSQFSVPEHLPDYVKLINNIFVILGRIAAGIFGLSLVSTVAFGFMKNEIYSMTSQLMGVSLLAAFAFGLLVLALNKTFSLIYKAKTNEPNSTVNNKNKIPLPILIPAILFLLILVYLSGLLSPRGCVTVSTINVRDIPSSGAVEGIASKGECFRFDAKTKDGGWVRIGGISAYRGSWVSTGYLEGLSAGGLKIVEP